MARTKKEVAEGTNINKSKVKKGKIYKLLFGTFKVKEDAIKAVIEINKNGFKGAIVIIGGNYTILLGEYKSTEAAEAAQKTIEAAGLKENHYTIKAM